jgi:peptide/nickel transport system substrate-binding protein
MPRTPDTSDLVRNLAMRRLNRRQVTGGVVGSALASALAPARGLAWQEATPEGAAEGEPAYGGTLIYARNIDAKTLDPHFSAQWSERFMLYNIYNTLVSWDTDFNIIPELAQSWEILEDGTGIVFNLVPNAVFHDGTACDATAVKWNLDRILNPDNNSNQRGQLEQAVASVEATDPTTLFIALKKPWRPLLAALGERPGFVVSPTAVENSGDQFALNPVGSGPFKFVEWVPDSHIIVERFDDYWDEGKPYLDRIEMRHVPDTQVAVTMVRTGEAQLTDEVDPPMVEALADATDLHVVNYESWRWNSMQMDVDKPPFDNTDFRQALAYGTDRETVLQLVFGGTGRVMTHPIAGGWAYDPQLDSLMQYDPAKAQELLASSGVAGQTLTMTTDNTRINTDLVQLLQAQYQELGVNVQIETVDSADYFSLIKDDTIPWGPANWTPRADPDGLLRILWHSTGFQNSNGYNNPEVDRLLDEAAGIYDTEKAAELYHEAERIIVEDASYVFIQAPAEFAVVRNEVGGFVYYPDLVLRLRNMWLNTPM